KCAGHEARQRAGIGDGSDHRQSRGRRPFHSGLWASPGCPGARRTRTSRSAQAHDADMEVRAPMSGAPAPRSFMIALRVHHRTTYRYHEPVQLGPHRLMLRPRESRELRLMSSRVTLTPPAMVSWAHDVCGNAVAMATFDALADHLVIDSVAE